MNHVQNIHHVLQPLLAVILVLKPQANVRSSPQRFLTVAYANQHLPISATLTDLLRCPGPSPNVAANGQFIFAADFFHRRKAGCYPLMTRPWTRGDVLRLLIAKQGCHHVFGRANIGVHRIHTGQSGHAAVAGPRWFGTMHRRNFYVVAD